MVSPPGSGSKRTPSPSPIVNYANNNAARITAMSWINESYDSLLMIGSDDGSIKVFKDASNSDMLSPEGNTRTYLHLLAHLLTHSYLLTFSLTHSPTHLLTHSPTYLLTYILTHSLTHSLTYSPTHLLTHLLTHSPTFSLTYSPTYSHTHSLTHSLTHSPTHHHLTHSLTYLLTSLGGAVPNVTLATSFVALPDVAETSRGSGMVFSFLQHTGTHSLTYSLTHRKSYRWWE